MFGIDSSELAIVALVALLVIGPKDLPRVMRMVGNWVSKGRAMTRHVRAGFDTMMREAELEEMQKAWAAQNDAIMKATALPDLGYANPLLPDASAPAPAAYTSDPVATDDWMAPPPLAPETVDVAPSPPPSPAPARPRRSRAKPIAAQPPTAEPAVNPAAKPARKRASKAAGEPQPSDT